MFHSRFGLLLTVMILAATATADDAQHEAVTKDRKQIEGTWRVTSLTINGNKAMDADLKKITVINGGDGTWSVRSDGKEISRGTSTFDPTRKPKAIDFTPTEGGGKGDQYHGIYRLGKDTRTLCFSPADKDRPTRFSSTPENQQILVRFERVKSE